jgi:hypothetical protein
MTPQEPLSTPLPVRKSLFDRLTTHLSRPRVLIPLSIGLVLLPTALAFIMGATIAMVFVVSHELVLSFENLVAYGFFAFVTILVFCLNMFDTYRVLSRAKNQELTNLVELPF